MALSKFLDPKNDVAFRKIFGTESNKDILIHFINDILELKDSKKIEDVEYLATVQPTKGFEKRAQYYAAKAYSRQLNSGSGEDGRYEHLKEVIFIAIANCTIFKDKAEYKSDHVILDKNSYEHDLQDFSFTFIELPKFKKDKISELETIIEKWCYFFKYAANTSEEDLKKLIGSDLVINQAYEALNQFNWTEQELIAYEQELKRIRDNRAAEDYLVEKGIEKGKAKRDIEIAKTMLSKSYSISDISSITGLSAKEIKELNNV